MGKIDVPELSKKIELLLRTGKFPIKTRDQLIRTLGIGKDHWSRIQGGTRVLTEELFVKLSDTFGIDQKSWFHSLIEFGGMHGFSRREIAVITNTILPGIDFAARIQDGRRIESLFALMRGYWESFYFSVSKIDRPYVSRDLMIVRRVNEDKFIECEIDDGVSRYKGWCFPVQKMLYFIMEKEKLLDEIIVYATNPPNRTPPRLYGIILCLSGDIDEFMQALPSAAKVAFRYLGTDQDVRQHRGLDVSIDVEEYLRGTVPALLDPLDPGIDVDTQQIIRDISNVLPADAIPSALRMDVTRRSSPK